MILPMYYPYPREHEAYQAPDQYMFGSEMMVAAVTTPCIKSLRMAKTEVWIPEGEWYDIFTGLRYHGDRKMSLYRDITSIPVLAKAGAVVPFQEDYMENAGENPKKLHIYVYTGRDGNFTLYEDDNITTDYQKDRCVKTNYKWQEETGCFCICSAKGETLLIPEKRDYIITFCGIKDARITGKVMPDGSSVELSAERNGNVSVIMKDVPVKEDVVLYLKERVFTDNEIVNRCFQILDRAEIDYSLKEDIFDLIEAQADMGLLLRGLEAMELNDDLYGALAEVINA